MRTASCFRVIGHTWQNESVHESHFLSHVWFVRKGELGVWSHGNRQRNKGRTWKQGTTEYGARSLTTIAGILLCVSRTKKTTGSTHLTVAAQNSGHATNTPTWLWDRKSFIELVMRRVINLSALARSNRVGSPSSHHLIHQLNNTLPTHQFSGSRNTSPTSNTAHQPSFNSGNRH